MNVGQRNQQQNIILMQQDTSAAQINQDAQMQRNLPNNNEIDLMTKSSNFVDQIRIKQEEADMEGVARPKSVVSAPGLEEARKKMEQTIVETEKFKASVKKPSGMTVNKLLPQVNNSSIVGSEILQLAGLPRQVIGFGSDGLSDDDFFHLMCHIDVGLRKKIENGEYVDLDKLLPKDNLFHSKITMNNETKLEWVQSEGST